MKIIASGLDTKLTRANFQPSDIDIIKPVANTELKNKKNDTFSPTPSWILMESLKA